MTAAAPEAPRPNSLNIKAQCFPKWLRELDRFLPLKSQLFLYGNIYDCYYFPSNYVSAQSSADLKFTKYLDIKQVLREYLQSEDYELVCYYDMLDGFDIASKDPVLARGGLMPFLMEQDPRARAAFATAKSIEDLAKLPDALNVFRALVANTRKLSAGIINYASRFTSSPNSLADDERRHFLKVIKAAQEAKIFPDRGRKRNVLIFLCDKLSDIPSWVLLDNPLSKGIEVQKPSKEERSRFFDSQRNKFFQDGEPVRPDEVRAAFTDLTDGFSSRELDNLITISERERLSANHFQKIIDLYRYGERENFWEKLEPHKVMDAEVELRKRVLGQDAAVSRSIEVIRRAKLGLHAIDSKKSNKPKGVLFFAGPTGTGKTEMAKSLAELIFNDEEAIVRFDMSEYNDSNSDVKLIGSPPGYVGYEEGGQLTRQMRAKPFSIVLFDEIEKAHPVVFDKFLQILDDGRLTDGKGETVYFGESLIIFTSNLGVYKKDEHGQRVANISLKDGLADVVDKVMAEVRAFFTTGLNRPEILNRFGDSFVVFDFIRPKFVPLILRKALNTIKANLAEQKRCEFHFDDHFVEVFEAAYLKEDTLAMGGRGINNRVETYVKNAMANFLFTVGRAEGVSFEVNCSERETDEWNRPRITFQLR